MWKRASLVIFFLGCSSPDPGTLDAHRATLGPGGAVSGSPSASGTSSGSGSGSGGGSTSGLASSGSSGGATSSSGSGSGGSGGSSGGSGSSGSGSSSGSSSGGSSGSPAADAGAPSSDVLQRCVDDINSYRATLGVPAYTRSSDLETFAATGAQSDAQSGQPHGHFISTNGGNGVAFAENEVPGWPLNQYGSVAAVVDQGMQMMWGEGPGGGHYENMASTQYTLAGCGTYTTSDGSVWVTTDFR